LELVTNCDEFGAESSLSTACDELIAICDEFTAIICDLKPANSAAVIFERFHFSAGGMPQVQLFPINQADLPAS
jgi:hypothetical protein